MSEVTGPGSVEVGAFTITSNTTSAEEMAANLKPKVDKAASEAASQLGKRGAEARAEAKAKRDEEPAPEADEKPAAKQIKPIPPKVEARTEPEEAEAEPEEKAEAKAEEAEEKPVEKPPNPRHDPKARMLEATRKEAEAKRALAEERAQRQQLEERLARLERGERPAPAAEPPRSGNGKPTPNDYETYEDYLDARDAYNREQWESELGQRAQRDAVSQALDQAVGRFRASSAQVYDQISDEVGLLRTEFQLAPGEQATGANWVANEIVFSPENAPALMLHFTAHPEDLQRIAALTTPRAVSREMAKLEARLEAASAGSSSKREDDVSRAAPPVRPVTGKPYVSAGGEYREGMSLDEYAKVWKPSRRR